jgi:nitrite reductase (NADH) small subunit
MHSASAGEVTGFVDVGACEDFVQGVPRVIEVRGREIGIVRLDEEFFALRNVCPHQYAPICRGFTMSLIVAEGQENVGVDENCQVLVCPWHGWEFDIRTGRAAWGQSSYRVKTYPVRVQGGRVCVDPGRAPRGTQSKGED